MLDNVIEELKREQRPYYFLEGSVIKGLENQYWLIFKHRDADKGGGFIDTVASFFGFKGQQANSHRLLRIDPQEAKVYTYVPRQQGNIPSSAFIRSRRPQGITQYLTLENTRKEPSLLSGSFRELRGLKGRYSLPEQLENYHKTISTILARCTLYRRSTAYFNSGVLKFYEEPLQTIVQTDGQIRLLMDWQGFTSKTDVAELEKLYNPEYRNQFIERSLTEFLQGLAAHEFSSAELMAELVRLEFLQIRLVKMDPGRSIYHKKTGIFTDTMGHHILHEGSDNFTRSAHANNAESVTFLYSWDSKYAEAIAEGIEQFDQEWQREDLTFHLSQEFLRQVLIERDRRAQQQKPIIDSIEPSEFPPGETTTAKIKGKNLDQVEDIQAEGDDLVDIEITDQQPNEITADITVDPEHPPQTITKLRVSTKTGSYDAQPKTPAQVTQAEELPEYGEIEGFRQAIELILTGRHGTPDDFLYWIAQQRPRQFRVEQSDLLDELVNQGILYEHQKSGAQHCLRVMGDFGVSVCADAVGLGKTRLAAAVARLYRQQNGQAKIAIIAARKLHSNWEREMEELGFRKQDYELYNKNLMSRKRSNFIDDFNRYGGPDLVIIDEAHEGIRNYRNRIHRLCLELQERDRQSDRQRLFLLLTATPWNNRREDIYNILSPFLNRPEGFTELGFPPELVQWFQNREVGVENFTDDSNIFRRTYRELFLQRTRQMLREAMPEMKVYAHRVAEWLQVQFESTTEQALEQIFTRFETELYIPFADPVRYLSGDPEQQALLRNQRRFFLQRAESSMYALKRTIHNFGQRIELMKARLNVVEPTAEGLLAFLLSHYNFEVEKSQAQDFADLDFADLDDREAWDEDFLEEEEDEEETEESDRQERRQQLRRRIELAIERLQGQPEQALQVYNNMLEACDADLASLEEIQTLLAEEFIKDHKRERVTEKVRELVQQGQKVLLISTFSDTVLDYFRYMRQDSAIRESGIGMAIGSRKRYHPSDSDQVLAIAPNNASRGSKKRTGIKRQELFRLFAPNATCRNAAERPSPDQELHVLIGSETLSVGQNLQDADYLINIDLPWNPMVLEQRIGRIDRPKQRVVENIYIYYANSESQLLRQASRLSNLNRKLVGNLAEQDSISKPNSLDAMGASIYGDTLFDDAILPGYIEFLQNLVRVRKMEQESLQEDTFQKQETTSDLYTHQEILFSEDVSKKLKEMGEDYQANPIALGRKIGDDEPVGLVALTLQYYGPNHEPLTEKQEILFWNDQTGERNAYGVAIASASGTPQAGDIFARKHLLNCAETVYDKLVHLKQQYQQDLETAETPENINISSERLNKIQNRILGMDSFPEGITRTVVKETLKKLNASKQIKGVQSLLRKYSDGNQTKLTDAEFITQLVTDTDQLSLIFTGDIKPTALKMALSALLLRA
jgi:hypothetical protein